MTTFQKVSSAILAGLPDGWDIKQLSWGESIHYYDHDDPWYVYAKGPQHYIEYAFPNKQVAYPQTITDGVKLAVEAVTNESD